ncbi:MAG TPA: DUF2391 family protein [Ardenticatenaceae bacterium]|jgi:putative integral membrane protein (TIGR02587 family)
MAEASDTLNQSKKGLFGFHYSPLGTIVVAEGEEVPLWLKELRDLARGFCGALFVALPLLYTEEMWNIARFIPTWVLLIALTLAYLANVGYTMFEGFKPEKERHAAWSSAVISLGLGALGSLITLLVIGQLRPSMPPGLLTRLILLETIPTSFGASLAINQLGARKVRGQGDQPADDFPRDVRKVLATALGAVLFSFNIAPTFETRFITITITWWHTLGLIGFSLFISYLMVSFADFIERDKHEGILGPVWMETLVAYLFALVISAMLLFIFGYLTTDTPLSLMIKWVVTLGYVTTLGGSAGRLIL